MKYYLNDRIGESSWLPITMLHHHGYRSQCRITMVTDHKVIAYNITPFILKTMNLYHYGSTRVKIIWKTHDVKRP